MPAFALGYFGDMLVCSLRGGEGGEGRGGMVSFTVASLLLSLIYPPSLLIALPSLPPSSLLSLPLSPHQRVFLGVTDLTIQQSDLPTALPFLRSWSRTETPHTKPSTSTTPIRIRIERRYQYQYQ